MSQNTHRPADNIGCGHIAEHTHPTHQTHACMVLCERSSKLLIHGQTMDDLGGPIALQSFRHMFL